MSKDYIETSDGDVRKIQGYKPGKPKPGTKFFKPGSKVAKLPPRVDLRKFMTAVEDQDQINSCTANAAAGAFEYLVKRHQEKDFDLSRMFVYYNGRTIDNSEDKDEGAYIGGIIEGLNKYGGCSEDTWPYEVDSVNEKPSDEAYAEAEQLKIDDYYAVEVELNQWKQALAEGYPIIFGINLYDSFESQRKPGVIPDPTKKDVSRDSHSAHAMLCVGYSDTDSVFIVRNSWGNTWGDKGYCYISYDYLMNPKQNLGDAWVIRQVNEIEDFDDSWEDDSSITGDYDTELADMSDDDYQEMLDAMGDYPLEMRIALIVLTVAAADGDVSDTEIEEIQNYVQLTLEKLGIERSATKLLTKAKSLVDNDELFTESVELLNTYLSNELLAKILNDVTEIVGVDDVQDEERELLDTLTEAWQIGDGESGAEGEEDSDEEDEDDEEDSDEEDESDDEEDEDTEASASIEGVVDAAVDALKDLITGDDKDKKEED